MSSRTVDNPEPGILNLKNLAGLESFSTRFARLSDFYILSNVDTSETPELERSDESFSDKTVTPMRLDGMLLMLIHKGSINFEVNTENYRAGKGDVLVVRPGTLLSFGYVGKETSFTLLFISTAFLNSLNIDLNSVELSTLVSRPRTVNRLTQPETELLRRYFDLLDLNAGDNTGSVFSTRIARTLLTAMVYEIIRFAMGKIELEPPQGDARSDRSRDYAYRFMELLHVHYNRERNIDFYARKLCISSKYLTGIIKNATGFSAAQWINRIVILEAKNMLRFSNKTVQEVAYAFNFPSQSAFGKYFKRITGMSPAAYIKSVRT